MSGVIWVITLLLGGIATVLAVAGVWAGFWIVAAVFAGTLLLARPLRFEIAPDQLAIVWPLWTRRIRRSEIVTARVVPCKAVKREVWPAVIRVGVGGLFGQFGWLVGPGKVVETWISSTDGLVVVEGRRKMVLTPERPEEFVAALGFAT
jgi:hypothetical protein